MRKIRNSIFTMILMFLVSVICLMTISVLSYIYKWQADKALVGITITYIVAGFTGGAVQRILNKEKKGIGRKMLEGIMISSIFMGMLLLLSIFVVQNSFAISSRFLMIWMILIGSTCIGRIL